MHSAAAVVHPIRRSRRAGLLAAVLWMGGAATVLAWLVAVPAAAAVQFALVAVDLCCGVLAALWWWRTPPSRLAWDGQAWRCEDSRGRMRTEQASAEVVLDLQGLLLLRLRPARGAVLWLIADREAAPASWHALRCALAAPVRAAGVVA